MERLHREEHLPLRVARNLRALGKKGGDRIPVTPFGSGLGYPSCGRAAWPVPLRLDPQLSQLFQPDPSGNRLPRRNLVDLDLCRLEPLVPLPEKSNAGGRECGRAQQVDGELANRSLL